MERENERGRGTVLRREGQTVGVCVCGGEGTFNRELTARWGERTREEGELF